MKKLKRPASNMFESLKNNPQEIIDWCDREIREYQYLKKLIQKELKKSTVGRFSKAEEMIK